jgi:redox-sensing transcriptional repressor
LNKDQIIRLSKYNRLLYKLKALGMERVFSNNLGDAIGVTPALVRKDFSILNLSGNKRGGYEINFLIKKLETILGKDKDQDVVIVGCGKIGTALMQYKEFLKDGIKIVAGFDVNPDASRYTSNIPVYDPKELKDFVKKNNIKVAIIAVPDTAANQVLNIMIEAGIKGILNFTPAELKGNDKCIIHNVNIALEIENLFYLVNLEDKSFENNNSL